MYYLPEQFKKLDEAHALTDSLQDLAPKLYETLNAAGPIYWIAIHRICSGTIRTMRICRV